MGKGDKRSKRGKIFMGSFGKSRAHKLNGRKGGESAAKAKKPAPIAVPEEAPVAKTATKKVAAKKPVEKKTAEKKPAAKKTAAKPKPPKPAEK
jgi:30S ribosomal protein S31